MLMLLPQSQAFKTLHARLHAVPTQALLQLEALSSPHPSLRRREAAVDSDAHDLQPLLALFRSRQARSSLLLKCCTCPLLVAR